jgi:nitrate/nitrite transport system ATP-binding protein
LDVDEGEFVAIVGFSGSGKTTLVSLIAGLLDADGGSLRFDGSPITSAGPDRAVIFQNYSLLPWLSVRENVLLAVSAVFPTWSRQKQLAHTDHYVEMVNLTPAARKRPSELSGGMRQRVSVARALAMSPRMLLLDEPLGALDALTRGNLQQEIQRILAAEGRTAVMITNDVDEAILLADRIVPLTPGPRATLGPDFVVPFERPRRGAELNSNAEFKRIRNALTQYLIDARDKARSRASRSESAVEVVVRLPDLKPLDLTA